MQRRSKLAQENEMRIRLTGEEASHRCVPYVPDNLYRAVRIRCVVSWIGYLFIYVGACKHHYITSVTAGVNKSTRRSE